eukprot:1024973-Prymnesium_polylepis.1
MTAILNAHLRRTGPAFSSCDDWSHGELFTLLHLLLPLRSPELQSIYTSSSDLRNVPAFEERWAADAMLLQESVANMPLVRDAACHDVVLLWVHHLSAANRTRAAAIVPHLPLLPAHEPTSDRASAGAKERHAAAVKCAACHSTTDPTPRTDGPARMPTNFNATIT